MLEKEINDIINSFWAQINLRFFFEIFRNSVKDC